ncbi:hypothetical protein K435DRAFT_349401 [Dendrothele bispora CBS 962.96]|uniref:Uncharacterized protein n=1 Tax=Dendrothele bispora (strain CBS 962.96) TaxID=1314807 RepID=A0A4S8LEN7_DENBC|nr:hypothetical protein K435DRAFT_349401 [Dendrothele bispora CBS 962.96]
MDSSLTLQELTRNRDEKKPITFKDGLAGGIHERTREFITCPNRNVIPRPPFGSTRDLYRRLDARYGEDDPLQWPQPYNRNHAYLPCIPCPPQSPDDQYYHIQCLWRSVAESDMDGTSDPKKGTLGNLSRQELSSAVEYVRGRSGPVRSQPKSENPDLELFSEFDTTMTVCLDRLSSVPSSFRDLQRGVVELQCACLYTIALLDYTDLYKPRMLADKSDTPALADGRMGAFVWNDKDALLLFKAGLPTYYVRHFSDFNSQNILVTCPLLAPALCMSVASPPYSIIFVGQAGADDKFASIRAASAGCFDVESPFQNMHLPGAYSSSYTIGSCRITSYADSPASASTSSALGPVRNTLSHATSSSPYHKDKPRRHKPKTKAHNPPKVQRDKFSDLPANNELAPSAIPAWKNVNKTIMTEHPEKRVSSGQAKQTLAIVPDPGMFFGTEDRTRQLSYLTQWKHIREVWLQLCRNGQEPLKISIWRKMLSLNLIGVWKSDGRLETVQHHEHKFATELLQSLFQKYSSGRSIIPTSSPHVPTSQEAKSLISELCLLSFRYQLASLDILADSSAPKPSPDITQADLRVALANHRRRRSLLIETVFGGAGDSFTLHLSTGLIAARWVDRLTSLRAFWQLMDSWPGSKPDTWVRGEDENLSQMLGPGEEWENGLARYYVQNYFNFYGHPPTLPCKM